MLLPQRWADLPDINTERPSFQEYFFKFINDCVACGADGFRYDTAKHIGLPDDPKEDDGFKNNFWEKVTRRDNRQSTTTNYLRRGVRAATTDLIISRLSDNTAALAAVSAGRLRVCQRRRFRKVYWSVTAPSNVVTWAESHDNYINEPHLP